jgi:hypothetical protein
MSRAKIEETLVLSKQFEILYNKIIIRQSRQSRQSSDVFHIYSGLICICSKLHAMHDTSTYDESYDNVLDDLIETMQDFFKKESPDDDAYDAYDACAMSDIVVGVDEVLTVLTD